MRGLSLEAAHTRPQRGRGSARLQTRGDFFVANGNAPERWEILLVERDPALREVASAWLRANDYAVREASTYSGAIVHLASGRCDLVVFDVSLASAEELTVLFWFGRRRPRVPVIGTLHEELAPRARECALELGIRFLLVKPFRLPVLLDTVRCALTTARLRT